ncbi:nuclear transport factor 2 family protein [Spirosoma validum]|uniref:Nuclear transport factor 2 family protein n=1 Tax=Spirosoma validum TaxID=2771355 RepID=A0A927GHC5_9BACT|nr:nuclear transport factor 2 family protein [Spirosoma validum]MBD2757794.1 nuclear transport factor 2 family protein [Spirosoma validum]
MRQLEQIQEVEQRLRQAMLISDVAELDALLADDLLAVGPDGQLVDKAADLAVHRSGTLHIKTMIPLETTIKLLPDVAIVFVLMNLQVAVQDQLIEGRYRYTRVWSRQTGNWQIIAAHISSVPN